MIPKILHQVWLGDKKIPSKFLVFTKRWRELHPDWQYCLWNEKKIDDTICINLMKRCDTHSARSNVIRIYALATIGGVYSDFDIEWKKNVDVLLNHKCFAAKEIPTRYCNAFLGSEKDTKWIQYMYSSLNKYVEFPTPWGPKLTTKASEQFSADLFTIDTKLVYPYLWNEKHRQKENFDDSYVVHHWEMSWKK
jgi:mannosyltransferase OCH1-like enzyme